MSKHRRVLSAVITLLVAGCASPPAAPVGGTPEPGASAAPAAVAPAATATYRTVELNGYAAVGAERLSGYSVEVFDAVSGAPLPIIGALAETAQAGPAIAYELRAGGAAARPVQTDGQGRFRLSVAGLGPTAVVVMVTRGDIRLRAVVDAGAAPQELAVTPGSTVAAGQVQTLAIAMGAIQDAGRQASLKASGYAVLSQPQAVDAALHEELLHYHAGLSALIASVDRRFSQPNPPRLGDYGVYFGTRSSDTADRAIADLSQALAVAVVANTTGAGEAKQVDPAAALAFLRQADPSLLPRLAWRLAHTAKRTSAEEVAQAMADGFLFLDGRRTAAPAGTGAFVAQVYQALARDYPAENGWLGALANKPAQRRVLKTSADFQDLANVDAALKAKIDALLSKGVFEGVSDDSFGLDANMSRAQFAKVLSLIYGVDASNAANTSSFSDIKADDAANGWAIPYIEAAKKAGLIDGLSDGAFDPRANATRDQLLALATTSNRLASQASDYQAKLPGTDAAVQSQSTGNGQPQISLVNTDTGAKQSIDGQPSGGLEDFVKNASQSLNLTPTFTRSSSSSNSAPTPTPTEQPTPSPTPTVSPTPFPTPSIPIYSPTPFPTPTFPIFSPPPFPSPSIPVFTPPPGCDPLNDPMCLPG